MKFLAVGWISTAVFFSACSNGPLHFSDPNTERLDALTALTVALSKRDFKAASSLMDPVDLKKMSDESGGIQLQYQDRLRAMRMTTLMNNPLINVEKGKVRGVFDILPVLNQGIAKSVGNNADADTAEAEYTLRSYKTTLTPDDPALKKTAEAFFKSIRNRNWSQAMSFVNQEERPDFIANNGQVREDARRRLAEIDTSSWDAMTLENGKLTGVVLLLPDQAN